MQERFKQFIESNDKASAVFSSSKEGTFTRYPHADMPADFNPLERSWYQEAMENKGQTIITDPYESISNKKMVVTMARAAQDGSGVVAIDIKIRRSHHDDKRSEHRKRRIRLYPQQK